MTAKELKQLRQKYNLTILDAARLVHVSARTWSRYETKDYQMPEAIKELFLIKVKEL